MRRYSLFHPFVLSFYSADLYRDVARHWGALPLLFLLVLLSVTWIPVLARMQSSVAGFVEDSGRRLAEQIPPVTIRNGEAMVEADQPYRIVSPETGEEIAILDTTGQVTSLDGTTADMLLTRNSFVTRGSGGLTREYPLAEIQEFHIDSDRAWNWMRTAAGWIGVVIYPFALAGSFLFRLAQCLLYALVGLLFAKIRGGRISYQSSVGLAIMAITPVVIFRTVLRMTDFGDSGYGVSIYVVWTIAIVVALSYLWFGVSASMTPGEGGLDQAGGAGGAAGGWSAQAPGPPA